MYIEFNKILLNFFGLLVCVLFEPPGLEPDLAVNTPVNDPLDFLENDCTLIRAITSGIG